MNKTNARKRMLIGYALVLPAFLVVMLTVAYPILSSVIMSFQDGKTGEFTLENYKYFFVTESQLKNIGFTLYCVSAGAVPALCQVPDLPGHRHALPAAAFHPRSGRGLRNDHHHP